MDPLTPRQAEVLAAFCATGSLEQAAAGLGLSPSTVKNHLWATYDRLGVRNGLAACYLLGWVEGRAAATAAAAWWWVAAEGTAEGEGTPGTG